MYARNNFKKDDNWNGLYTKINFKKDDNDKVTVDKNINNNKFLDHVIDPVIDDKS